RELTSEGKTLILTTHYMEEAAQLCDRLVVMEGGRIIALGSPDELVEEHVSPEVLELRAAPDAMGDLLPLLEDHSDAVERAGNALLAYTADAGALQERVRNAGVSVDNMLYRRAGLEDVFMRLTGRRLID
ncbi:MAG: ABC transporter ATP-binding protein, partial [Actinomycetota bacterium]|nr:ABC transporter ATP-binding protein [Actinomycetota bacterium]